jgi:nucleoside-diphosphate-sugar epimerase
VSKDSKSCYALDAGEALARVGTGNTSAHVYHVPSDAPRSQAEIIATLALELHRTLSATPTPRWVLSLLGIARPEMGALVEMLYEFTAPFVVDDRASRALLEQSHTPFEHALQETVAWFSKGRELPQT